MENSPNKRYGTRAASIPMQSGDPLKIIKQELSDEDDIKDHAREPMIAFQEVPSSSICNTKDPLADEITIEETSLTFQEAFYNLPGLTDDEVKHEIRDNGNVPVTNPAKRKLDDQNKPGENSGGPNNMQQSKTPSTSRKVAEIWKHFQTIGKFIARCRYCLKPLVYNSSTTSNLKKHLQRKHPAVPTNSFAEAPDMLQLPTQVPNLSTSIASSTVVSSSHPTENTMENIQCKALTADTSRKVKKMAPNTRKVSKVWDHYMTIGKSSARCRYCHVTLVYNIGTTSNMKKHLQRKHPTILTNNSSKAPDMLKRLTKIPGSSTSVASSTVVSSSHQTEKTMESGLHKRSTADTKREANVKITKMIVQGYHPLSIVEEPGFIELIKHISPDFQIPDRKAVANSLIPSMYEECLEIMKNIVTSAKAVALTTEAWTNINNTNFIAVTAHFIDISHNLQTYLLKCSEFTVAYTEKNISEWLNSVVASFNISDKIVATVTDNTAIMNVDETAKSASHLPCFGHTLNKVIIDSIDSSIKPLVDEVKQIVEYFKKSSIETTKLLQIHPHFPALTLKQDVATRWIATFDMLDSFRQNKESLLLTFDLNNIRPDFEDRHWLVLDQALEVLQVFSAATKELYVEDEVTISKMGVLCRILIIKLKKMESNSSFEPSVKDLIQALLKGMIQNIGPIKDNELLREAIFLDPRYKQAGFMEDHDQFEEIRGCLITKVVSEIEKEQSALACEEASCSTVDITADSLWKDYDLGRHCKGIGMHPTVYAASEVDNYIKYAFLERKADPLVWWKKNSHFYPYLYNIMLQRLCIPATSVPCEAFFSKTGQIYTERRNRLVSKKVEEIVFLKYNYDKCSGKAQTSTLRYA